jgi:parallel beta-helix repeat protein/predicted outer membrane repeat protein
MSQKGRDSTTIRPNSKSKVYFRAINCDGVNASTVISGFSIVGGESGSRGGGILCYNGATPQITFNRFSDNISYQGAAICCEYGSNATISDNIFTSNNSDFGSGVHCFESSPIIRNNDFTGNTGPGGYTMGVIACDMSSSPIVSGNTFTRSKGRAMYYTNGSGGLIRDNTVTGDTLPGGWRGACLFCGSGSVPQIISNTFSHNRAPVGAGIYLEMGSSATIDSNTFTSNSADTGAGIYCDFSAPDISNNTFTNNLGGLEGGYTEAVIYCDFSQAGTQMMGNTITGTKGRGIYFNNNSAGDVVGNTIIGDTLPTVSTWDGAGMYCNNGSLPTIRGNTLSENRAVNGGAIACRNGADPTITSNTITGNRAEIPGAEGFGGGIFVYGGSATITMDSNTVTGNSARWGGGIACYQSGGASVRILHNLVKSNTADSVGGGISCYQSSPWILRNNVIENRAHYGGAISCRHMSGPTIQVCVIERNIANNLGGGIYCTDHCDPSIVDNTIVGNVSASSSGICSADSSKPGIERNAIMDNACGVHFLPTSGLMGFVGANNIYYNTYQPAPTDYDVINETAGTANFPNSWWGTSDSATVDGNIDGDVAFMPILSAPAPTGCGEPSAVTSVTIYGDAGYSGELVETDIGDTVYIELMGTDWRSSTRDPAMVILESQIDAYGIGLALVETEVHNGCYHGYAVVDTASNDLYNHIAADTNGFIVVRSNVGSVCDTVYMPVAAPVMIAEPTYTPDTINTVHWTSASNEYYAECDTNSSFGSIHSSSGWITDTFFTFTSLDNDVTYYYRAKTRNSALVESDWSNTVSSTQDAVSPTISSLTPQDGAYLSTTVFPVSARYVDTPSSGIDTSSVVIRIDGGDVTSQATVTDSMVSYTPASPLSDTIHVAFVKVGDNVGNVDSATWSFEVDTTEPVSPVLLSPDDSIWFNDTTIAFEWGTVAKLAPVKYVATSYKASTRLMHFKVKASSMRYVFQADTSASFGSPMIVDTTVTGESVVLIPPGMQGSSLHHSGLAWIRPILTSLPSFLLLTR